MATLAAITAGHELTAQAAEAILHDGGNAFDATLGGFFMACVAEPVLASLGGGGFLLAHAADTGDTTVFDFFTQTPGRKRPVAELDFEPVMVDFGSTTQEFHMGLGAIAVPGCVRGMFAVHRSLGSMPMREIVRPALDAARAGITVSALQAHVFSLVAPIYITRPAPRALFASCHNSGCISQVGEVLRFNDLADTLEVITIEGDDLFYCGEIAQLIHAQCEQGGGCITRDDLMRYEVFRRRPLTVGYRHTRLLTNPPPASGGCLVAFALKLVESLELHRSEFGSADHLSMLAEVMKQTNAARIEAVQEGDSELASGLHRLLNPDVMTIYREQVQGRMGVGRGTTHINVSDKHGNVASMTVSNGEGCGEIVPGTGLMLNNMLGEEDLNPSGFHAWELDQRMSSMMAPSMVALEDGRLIATGSGGSNRIRDAVLQVILNIVDFEMHAEQAVSSPRIHFENDVLYIEGGYEPSEIETLLTEFPHFREWDELSFFFGGAHTLVRGPRSVEGAGDPRRGGVCRISI